MCEVFLLIVPAKLDMLESNCLFICFVIAPAKLPIDAVRFLTKTTAPETVPANEDIEAVKVLVVCLVTWPEKAA